MLHSKRYLFLDFDGVLHVEGGPLFDNLPFLERVITDLPFVDIIISSTWRLSRSLDELRMPFARNLHHRITGVTPSLPSGLEHGGRQDEIECFIAAEGNGLALTNWVAVDDTRELFQPCCKQLLHVNSHVGLTKNDAARLAEMLL